MPTLALGKPQPKQELFLTDTHKHVAFGGARGGGKSWAIDYKATLLCLGMPGIKVGIVRTTYPELTKNHIEPLKNKLVPTFARYNDSKKEMRFPNGSIIYFMYCNNDNDAMRFSGIEVDVLFIDEATHFKKEWLDKMRACVRGVNKFVKRVYYTCNPDGVSLTYIKRLFVDKKYELGENPDDYAFIQSLLTDNEILMKSDPTYKQYLESLPPKLRQAWLDGRWDVFEGAYFEEFRETPDLQQCIAHGISVEDAYREHKWTHVIEPFDIPDTWPIFKSYDWGFGKPFHAAWYTLSPQGVNEHLSNVLYMIIELYGCTQNPNEGVKWSNEEQMQKIAEIEREHPWLKGKKIRGFADPSIWDGSHDSNGVSAADIADKYSLWFEPASNERIPGWMQVRERMKFDEEGYSKLYFFKNCKGIIRTMPLMMFDEHKVEDLDTDLEDHACDSLRYICMGNPIAPRLIKEADVPYIDPLNLYTHKDHTWSNYNRY